jgi:hypothetical protein
MHINSVLISSPRLVDHSPFKRRRFSGPCLDPLEVLLPFWKNLWRDKENPFRTVSVRRDSNPVEDVDVATTINVFRIPTIFSPIGDVMIREEYGEAMKDIEGYRTSKRPKRPVVVAGPPGIGRIMGSVRQACVLIHTPPYLGKTILLYYILVRRLLEQKRTILQNDPDVLFLFDANGVTELKPHAYADPGSEVHRDTWALVDCNQHVQTPAPMLARDASPFFLVIASSPRASRWKGVHKHRGPINLWFMKPFTLAELIQASVSLGSISELSCVTYTIF